jgi:signal transduction histidine kinase
VLARSGAHPAIPPGLVEGDAAAIDRMDRTALDRLLVDDVLRIKLWDAEGRVLYSDRTELIGAVYPLGDDELEVLRDGGTDAELSDLGRPENRFERDLGGDLLEVYTRVRSPEGEPLLFEAYLGVDDIRASRTRILDRFLPISIGALVALVALGTPLVVLLSRRLSRAARERERLLEAAVRASDAERLRIARDLHDGVVQDLSGSSMALSALAAHADEPHRRELEDVGRSLRVSMRSLRSLLVEIYPPDLHTAGLAAAVDDLVAPLVAAGTTVDVDVSGADGAPRPAVALVWRVAQEAVRNVARHARADRMSLTVRHEDDRLVLEVVDDGVGFDPTTAPSDDHFGLRATESLVREHGGTWEVESAPGSGTMVRVEVPVG